MRIQNCTKEDIDIIYNLYEDARLLQASRKMVVWPHFEKQFLEKEIENGQQWKILIDGKMACNWTITYADKEIWEERDRNDAIYIHRIVTNPDFRGNNFVKLIVDWAMVHAAAHNKQYVRLDTLGNNTKLIEHYTNSGFTFLGMVRLTDTSNLPLHYQKEPNCCLFEIGLHKEHDLK